MRNMEKCMACSRVFPIDQIDSHVEQCPEVARLRDKRKPLVSIMKTMDEDDFNKMEHEAWGRNCCQGVCASHAKKINALTPCKDQLEWEYWHD